MTEAKYYTPGDPTSSPYNPVIGAIALVQMTQNPAEKDLRPGIITRVYGTEDDRCDITVFTPSGVYHLTRVPFYDGPADYTRWCWPTPPSRRVIKAAEKVVPGTIAPLTAATMDTSLVVQKE